MSIDWQNLGLFAAASLALVLTPGPNTLYVMTRGIAQGRKAALISALGASWGIWSTHYLPRWDWR